MYSGQWFKEDFQIFGYIKIYHVYKTMPHLGTREIKTNLVFFF